ncbi:hypothetical protein PQU92_11230 [Asticcacaulis sp. BYS171W]|uniref:PBCV-specific basic adaptor domain-containing protein n=1 Tax=Asticcacaulis aquaticus TaxID=2984212 RepID=A0ABT5HUW9_9CAUL|nr:hypothetical protein [Asticcacaulis aquaticus]MDC7683853.1 hypothetical protein [Asticcacaulis aquaticus]
MLTKRFLVVSGLAVLAMPQVVSAENTYKPKTPQKYIRGKRGGCYYINKNGNKTYVDRSLCK